MLNGVPGEFRKFLKNCDSLRRILGDTQHALHNIRYTHLKCQIKEQVCGQANINSLEAILDSSPSILVFGQNCSAKAILVNALLDEPILPLDGSHWRWVKILYGYNKAVRLTLGQEYEIVERLQANEGLWQSVPEKDLQRDTAESPLDHCPTVEVELYHPLLRENVTIIVPPDCEGAVFSELLGRNLDRTMPIIVYAISAEQLSHENISDIRAIKEKFPDTPLLFVSIHREETSVSTESLTESEQHFFNKNDGRVEKLINVRNQLVRIGFLAETNSKQDDAMGKPFCTECLLENTLISDLDLEDLFVLFVRDVLKSYLLKLSTILSEIHNNSLRIFILSAFDMAREIQITPRRIHYAQKIELQLYDNLMKIASENQEEITKIIQQTLQQMRNNIEDVLDGYQYKCEDDQHSTKMATMEIHQIVLRRLSNSVATQLVLSVGCLQESFTGTLQRCLEALEQSCHEIDGNLLASDAVKQILSAAYNIDLTSSTKFTVVSTFIDKLRKLVSNFHMPWRSCVPPNFDYQWQAHVVTELIDTLSSSKLAKTISTQFQEHIRSSHDAFKTAIHFLENRLSGKLEQTEEQRILIRKKHAPKLARLALESTSLCDMVRYGMPKQTKEVGRGQYGVVFSSEPWGNVNPCAVKSVVPPDERHWNDLAMEFYYTRTIPEHCRIVKLRGSVVDYSYGGGSSPAVLLVMEQMTRDLYCGLKKGLTWKKRIQIAIDVVEGIRYLHSQGLVHRDIKLKNVLLDTQDRAKLTDFGFCMPEAMMSGSIVGTPVHMAPELLSGRYDSSVDVYAFGILFWYICAGQVKLPNHFEQFHNKEQLWTSVRRGTRPECLANFTQACWNLMEQCWAAEPYDRPLLGYVQPQLENIQRVSAETADT